MTISRRVFLKNGGFALVSLGFAPSFLARTAFAASSGRKQLITIFQRGAVDGLSVIVPHGEADYFRARPAIAVARPGQGESAAINLDGFFGLNPRLAGLKPLWDQRTLAVVHACGSPDATRSHFDAQDYMESGTPGVKSTGDGWLNRYLQAREAEHGEAARRSARATRDGAGITAENGRSANAFQAVALSAQLPRALQGPAPALAMSGVERFGVSGPVANAFESEYAQAADRVLNGVGREAFDAMKTLKQAAPSQYRAENGARYPRTAFGQALQQIAQLCKSDVGLEIAFAEISGWDTHVNQGSTQGQLATRLTDFGDSLAALVTDLGERMAETVILTMSEFGRAVAENGNRGTDHGHGNAMLVIGGNVRGGHVYGRWPGLAAHQRYEGRDLAITTGFRDVFGEVVVRHLGLTDAARVFPGYQVSPARFPGVLPA